MGRSKSSRRWLQEHFQDEYVKKAKALGYRSRAVFKLKEIQEKDRIIRPGMNIVDLGAAPGGWSQYAQELTGNQCTIVALDILPIEPIPGVEVIQGDFRENTVWERLSETLGGKPVDLVMSDMAPNISGNKEVDQPHAIYLAELALDAARTVLAQGGGLLIKVFQGEGFDGFKKDMQSSFCKVLIRKPKSSRPRSREVYILAKGFKK